MIFNEKCFVGALLLNFKSVLCMILSRNFELRDANSKHDLIGYFFSIMSFQDLGPDSLIGALYSSPNGTK